MQGEGVAGGRFPRNVPEETHGWIEAGHEVSTPNIYSKAPVDIVVRSRHWYWCYYIKDTRSTLGRAAHHNATRRRSQRVKVTMKSGI